MKIKKNHLKKFSEEDINKSLEIIIQVGNKSVRDWVVKSFDLNSNLIDLMTDQNLHFKTKLELAKLENLTDSAAEKLFTKCNASSYDLETVLFFNNNLSFDFKKQLLNCKDSRFLKRIIRDNSDNNDYYKPFKLSLIEQRVDKQIIDYIKELIDIKDIIE